MTSHFQLPDDLEKHILKPDDTFRFRCKQCGKCCKNREDILISPFDLFRIARHFSITPIEAVKRYCRAYIGQSSRMPVMTLKAQGAARICPFLKNNRCSIHRAKPTVCALFPLGRAASVVPNGANETIPQGTFYFLQPVACGGKDEAHTVREWLGEFGLEESGEWFDLWQRTIAVLCPLINRIEALLPEKPLEAVRDTMIGLLYLDYEGVSEFLPRFAENAARLQKILRDFLDLADKMRGGKA